MSKAVEEPIMLIPMLLALVAPAEASSDIEFKTNGPVLIYVDGQQAQLTNKLKQKVTGLEPGDHEIKVTGVFGKTLYEADISLPDNTITQAEWSGRELAVLSTDWLADSDDEEDEDELVAEAPEEEPVEEEELLEEEEEIEEEVVAEADELPLALPIEEPTEEAIALPRPDAPGRTLTVQASEGMRVEVVHEGQVVTVVVKDGVFQIEDPSGLQLALSGS